VVATAVLASALCFSLAACGPRGQVVIGFWFDPVTYSSSGLGGRLTHEDLTTIEVTARSELRRAFEGLQILVGVEKTARYRVRVVQHLSDPRFRGDIGVAGASTGVSWFGGNGAVNFSFLAAGAESFAPPDAERAAIVTAIGRGVGRAAVHEFVHQLLGTARYDRTLDRQSYEFGSADRPEQYWGELHWAEAWPALRRRFGETGGP
jgi:hypothetical protein